MTSKIAIITDTDSSLPAQIAAMYGIIQVPITIHFKDETLTTGVDIDDRSLFEKVDRLNCLPTTAAPNPADFEAAFAAAFARGAEAIVCVCVSSQISSTYTSATTACDGFAGRSIRVIDSLDLSMGQGFIVLEAAKAAACGASLDEVVERAESVRSRLYTVAMLTTLKYLALGGRANKFMTGLADTLNIKPILSVKDGKLDMVERVRTHKKAMERLIVLAEKALNDQSIERLAVIHVNNSEDAAELSTMLRARFACPSEIIVAGLTPGLSVHAGAGLVGLVALRAR